MLRRFHLLCLIMVVLVIGTLSCQSRQNQKPPQTSGEPMKVPRYYWPGSYWVEIADTMGWFKEAGLNVELIDTNPDYYASLDDMVAGKMDTNNFSLFDMIRHNLRVSDLVMVMNSDNSFGLEAIVAKEDITNIKNLRGKRIGVRENTYLDYIVEIALERVGLESADCTIVDVVPEKVVEAFIAGSLDAVVTWEPFVTEAVQRGKGKKLFDTSEIPGILPNGFAFHRSFIEKRGGDVQAFVHVWHRTTLFIKEHPKEAFGIIAGIYRKPPGEVQDMASKDRIMDMQDNLGAFLYSSGFESLHGVVRYMNNYFIKHKATDALLDSTDYLDARFVRALKQE